MNQSQLLDELNISQYVLKEVNKDNKYIGIDFKNAKVGSECLVLLRRDNNSRDILKGMLSVLDLSWDKISAVYFEDNLSSSINFIRLREKIFSFHPKTILILGEEIARLLLQTDMDIEELRKTIWQVPNKKIDMVITYSPMFLKENSKYKRLSYNDLCVLKNIIWKS